MPSTRRRPTSRPEADPTSAGPATLEPPAPGGGPVVGGDAAATAGADGEPAVRFVVVMLNRHAADALERARRRLVERVPGLDLRVHVATDFESDPDAIERCQADLREAHFVLAAQVFLEQHVRVVTEALDGAPVAPDAVACVLCAAPMSRLTHLGRFSPSGRSEARGWSPKALLQRLRGGRGAGRTAGERQMRQLRRLPKLLRFVPGPAQDLRAFLILLQCWLSGSADNLVTLLGLMIDRYAAGPRERLRGRVDPDDPEVYPDTGVYHPAAGGMAESEDALPLQGRPRVGVLVMRSYILAGNTAHYDGVIRALEARGLDVVPAFASGLDSRPAIDRFFRDDDGAARIEALVSLTGFSLVGGPAYSDLDGAREALATLDVPYVCVSPLEFQTVEEWTDDERGLHPVQSALMVAVPELDGATSPMVFGGRTADAGDGREGVAGTNTRPVSERVERLAERVARLVRLRRKPTGERRIAITLFNFPPNAGAVGTAAYLDVFASLHRTLESLRDAGYRVDVPESAESLRARLLEGNAGLHGTPAHVHTRIPVDDHVRREEWLAPIEAAWGAAPGRHLTDGAGLFILGERFGDVFVGVQPPFGYEGDPMRLLFDRGFAPTHAFSAFYRWIREDFDADAVIHFGTHGALEFMPGKHVGLSGDCWPERLIGALPNLYLYASNNPSEGTLAKRRAAATLVSYLTPSVARAGLYRGLLELRESLDRLAGEGPRLGPADRAAAFAGIRAQAEALDLAVDDVDAGDAEAEARALATIRERLLELEYTLIPTGLHVLGEGMAAEQRIDLLLGAAEAGRPEQRVPSLPTLYGLPEGVPLPDDRMARSHDAVAALVGGRDDAEVIAALGLPPDRTPDAEPLLAELRELDGRLRANVELDGLLHALDGGFVPPAPGGDVLRNPDVLPTGRNLYGFDPHRLPAPAVMPIARRQVDALLARHRETRGRLPECLGLVLWATDTMKSAGVPVAQALALLGAEPRFDSYGRLSGARLIPLATLGRPRIDVVVTVSGIFRDLLPLQLRLLAEAAWLAATADEPVEENWVRRHAQAHAEALGVDLGTAALRIFGNADGAYGANVNHLVESGSWQESDELAETFVRRKGFAYGRSGTAHEAHDLFREALRGVEATYQNLDSIELGVSDVDQYVDSLGGLTRAAGEARSADVPAYVLDRTRSEAARVRTLAEQVELEARTRVLNPRWYEAMLAHGYQGVREIETRATAALGWSATTGATPSWVFQRVTETFVLDPEMRRRLAALNTPSAARIADRMLEASDRGYWTPDEDTLDALRRAGDELDDRLEGLNPEAAA
jgi:magnesium chelatase subunit H